MGKGIPANISHKKAGLLLSMPDNLNFMTKNYTIDKKRTLHSDWRVNQEDIILNMYIPDNRASKFMKENVREKDKFVMVVKIF